MKWRSVSESIMIIIFPAGHISNKGFLCMNFGLLAIALHEVNESKHCKHSW